MAIERNTVTFIESVINGILVRVANPFLYSVGSRNVDMESHKNTCKIKKIIEKVENEKMKVFTTGHGSEIAVFCGTVC